jgi:hypothetical protein
MKQSYNSSVFHSSSEESHYHFLKTCTHVSPLLFLKVYTHHMFQAVALEEQ